MKWLLLVALAGLAAAAQHLSVADSSTSADQIRSMVEANAKVFSEGVRNHDFESIAALYTQDAKYGKDSEDFVIGHDAIREDWKQFIASGQFADLILEPMTIQGSGSVIYETGRGYTTRSQGKPPYKFKYVNVWVRQPDGSYKLDVDFYNDLP